MTLFSGFAETTIQTGEASIFVRSGGSGPPVVLLHGHPQTSAIWHLIAPRLAETHTVILPDLRGYGASSRPPTTPDHEPYSKRAMGRDVLAVMRHFGFDRFAVVGHDRGGRVGYRLALDHPHVVERLTVLDILPTVEHFQRTEMQFALRYFHWFFLAQPAPMPECLINADPESYYFRGNRHLFHPDAMAEYLRWCHDPTCVHAMCEDYRAAATFDYALDLADQQAGRKIVCPVQALWGSNGPVGQLYDVLAVWRLWTDNVTGKTLNCGHYLPEECPDAVLRELLGFLPQHGS
jgi:haloacetate dehalogenase